MAIKEVVADKGYHSNQVMVDLEAVGVRSYISEPDRGRRNWKDHPDARDAVYRKGRRIRGARGKRLLRQRGERLERPCAHLYETGRMRRVLDRLTQSSARGRNHSYGRKGFCHGLLGPYSGITIARGDIAASLCADADYIKMRLSRMALIEAPGSKPPHGVMTPAERLKRYCETVAKR